MTLESPSNSLIWDSSHTPLQFQPSPLSNIPSCYHCSLVAPVTLSQRKHYSPPTKLHLPPLKVRSTISWTSPIEGEHFLTQSCSSTERELTIIKQKYDRLRASLSQSLEYNRHAVDKVYYKKTTIEQTISRQEESIDRLLGISIRLNEKIRKARHELNNQRQQRNNHEMQQLKLRRTLICLNENKEEFNEILKTNDKAKFLAQCEARLLKLKNECEREITEHDQQIEELKGHLAEEFHYQSDEHLKFIKAANQAFQLESEKRDILQEYIDEFESHIYRARKPCCKSTSHRLSKLSTQFRLYLIIELALHELIDSSCSCGSFKRSYQTFLRLHKK